MFLVIVAVHAFNKILRKQKKKKNCAQKQRSQFPVRPTSVSDTEPVNMNIPTTDHFDFPFNTQYIAPRIHKTALFKLLLSVYVQMFNFVYITSHKTSEP